jgi:uracil DNA glycosylase
MCPISQVKVVILGQDPYHNPQQAHGMVAHRSVQVSLPLHRAHLMITDASVFLCILKLNVFYIL